MSTSKVLIVVSENGMGLDLQEKLRSLGYEVPHPISTGERAIFQILDVEPDVVIMGTKLEGDMDGFNAAKEAGRNCIMVM